MVRRISAEKYSTIAELPCMFHREGRVQTAGRCYYIQRVLAGRRSDALHHGEAGIEAALRKAYHFAASQNRAGYRLKGIAHIVR
jgi:allophanate hydrolase subunit 2